MTNGHTDIDYIIVTGHTVVNNAIMIKDARRKGTGSVATSTIFRGGHMVKR